MPDPYTAFFIIKSSRDNMASDKIQANLDPKTVQRLADITKRPVTRGIDKMINDCLDTLGFDKDGNVRPCTKMMETDSDESE